VLGDEDGARALGAVPGARRARAHPRGRANTARTCARGAAYYRRVIDRRTELERAARTARDDGERRVYADFLEEQGELARADLIRAQCELTRLPEGDRCGVEARW